MPVGLILEIAKVVGTVVIGGVTGYQTTGTVEGALAAAGTALAALFVPKPQHLFRKGK